MLWDLKLNPFPTGHVFSKILLKLKVILFYFVEIYEQLFSKNTFFLNKRLNAFETKSPILGPNKTTLLFLIEDKFQRCSKRNKHIELRRTENFVRSKCHSADISKIQLPWQSLPWQMIRLRMNNYNCKSSNPKDLLFRRHCFGSKRHHPIPPGM